MNVLKIVVEPIDTFLYIVYYVTNTQTHKHTERRTTMKSWKGLFRREWIHLKWWVLLLGVVHLLVAFVGPVLISKIFGTPQDFFSLTLILSSSWLVFNMFIAMFMLLQSLGYELKRVDVWLHSPASMLKLVGSKAIFAVLTTGSSLLFGGILLGISFYLSESRETLTFSEGALPLLSVLVSLFLYSILLMAITFFIWSVYQVLRSRVGEWAVIFTIVVVFIGLYGLEKIRILALFSPIFKWGPVQMTTVSLFNEQDSYFFTGIAHNGVMFTLGGLLLNGLIVALLFIGGSVLFEKKVRL